MTSFIQLIKKELYNMSKLAQTHSLIYKREMTLTLVYNYKVNNVGLRENDRRVLKRIT